LREALRGIDNDVANWSLRSQDETRHDVTPEMRAKLARLNEALATMRRTLRWPSELADASPADNPAAGAPGGAAREEIDRAYLALIDAVQSALQAARSDGERTTFRNYTESEISAAVVVGASFAALLMGGVLAGMLRRARQENQAAISVMGELLRTDPLTGITNRRGLDENLPVEMARAKRATSKLTVAMLDLDFFKRYNSRRGHAGGDSLLRAAAQAWRRQLRPTDTLVRYGGEEFTLVLPNCGCEQAQQLIDRLRPLMPDNQTFSAGIATWDYHESAEQLLRRADEALLAAKKQGRNRTIVSGQEEQISLLLPPVA
jgi:diguanylate cyclase (GGDEF)-like protein